MQVVRIALVGDFRPDIVAHRAVNESMRLAGDKVEARWVHTSSLGPGNSAPVSGAEKVPCAVGKPDDPKSHVMPYEEPCSISLDSFDGIWCVPGSPYANTDGALWAIEWARSRHVPFLGTCGGFQHALLEFARHVLGRPDAAHAELDPAASVRLIAPLACALVEKSQTIRATGRGRFVQWYGTAPRTEEFHCSFGLNPACEVWLEKSGLEIVARNECGEVRAVELLDHKFFVGTLFQPERAALNGVLHPLVEAFLQAAAHDA